LRRDLCQQEAGDRKKKHRKDEAHRKVKEHIIWAAISAILLIIRHCAALAISQIVVNCLCLGSMRRMQAALVLTNVRQKL